MRCLDRTPKEKSGQRVPSSSAFLAFGLEKVASRSSLSRVHEYLLLLLHFRNPTSVVRTPYSSEEKLRKRPLPRLILLWSRLAPSRLVSLRVDKLSLGEE